MPSPTIATVAPSRTSPSMYERFASGRSSAWTASTRDLHVVLLEQFDSGHKHGSSHGSARIFRRAYPDDLHVQHFLVHDVQGDIGATAFQELVFFPKVRGNYIGIAIDLPKGERQFDADLSAGANNQYLFFGHVRGFGLQT